MSVSAPPTRRASRLRAVADAAGTCFHAFVLGIYPALFVLSTNAGVVPLNPRGISRALAVSAALVAAILVLLKPVLPELRDRAFWTSCFLLGLTFYPALRPYNSDATYAASYVAACLVAATLLTRVSIIRERSIGPLNLAACSLLFMNLYYTVPAIAGAQPWRASADKLIQDVVPADRATNHEQRPDIYYIVLDGFGRQDILKELYAFDLGPFVKRLEALGFVVPTDGRSNYAQTYPSLASSLNMTYLDTLANGLTESKDRRALYYLIQHNALFALAKRAGYRVIGISSNYSATKRLATPDICFCEQYGLYEFETAVLDRTPLNELPIDRFTYGGHRQKIEQQFHHLETKPDGEAPALVFAHIIAPHPPFVFDAEGRPLHPQVMFGFEDANHFRGSGAEYLAGYRGQAQFVARRILEVIETILERPGPSPLIVVHGDHGPALRWNWNNVAAGDARERLAIFSAIRVPGLERAAVRADISPVNLLRLVANRALGVNLPQLEDRSFESSWERPYKMVPIETERLVKPLPTTQH